MITKTLSGISMLDEPYGGVFSNRGFLVTGAKDTGKTVMGLQFIQQGLEQNDRCLYLSTMVADDLGILAESLGFKLSYHVESEALTLLEYESFITGSGAPGLDMLPPEGFDQLRDIIHTNSIERIVLDTVLPWVSVRDPARMPQQVFSFARSLDRLGVTSMLTLPKPVSTLAFKLKKSIEDVVPISVLLQPAIQSDPATFQVVKYLGEKRLGGKLPVVIKEGVGICEGTNEGASSADPSPTLTKNAGEPSPPGAGGGESRPRFSAIQFDRPSTRREMEKDDKALDAPVAEPSEAPPPPSKQTAGSFVREETASTAETPPPPEPPSESKRHNRPSDKAPGVRLSSIWEPQSEPPSSGDPSE